MQTKRKPTIDTGKLAEQVDNVLAENAELFQQIADKEREIVKLKSEAVLLSAKDPTQTEFYR